VQLGHRLFAALDQNKSGTISKLELFNGLSQLLDGSKEEKAELFFNLYDFDGSGVLDKDEVIHMVLNSQETVDTSVSVASKMLHQLDVNGDGKITLQEFKVASRSCPSLLQCFGALFGLEYQPLPVEGGTVGHLTRMLRGEISAEERKELVSKTQFDYQRTPAAVREMALNKVRRMSLNTLGEVVNNLQVRARGLVGVGYACVLPWMCAGRRVVWMALLHPRSQCCVIHMSTVHHGCWLAA